MKFLFITSLLAIAQVSWGEPDKGKKHVKQPVLQRLENAIKLHKDGQGKAVINPASIALLRESSSEGDSVLRSRKIRNARGARSHIHKDPCAERRSNIQERGAKRVFNASFGLDAPAFDFTAPTASSLLNDVLCSNMVNLPATVVLGVTPAINPTVVTPKPTASTAKASSATLKATAATGKPAVAAAKAALAAKAAAKLKAVQAARKAVAAANAAAVNAAAKAKAALDAKKAAAAKAAAAKQAAANAKAAAAAQARAAAKAVAEAKAAAAARKAAAAKAQATKKAAAAAKAAIAAKKANAAKAAATATAAAATAKAKAAHKAAQAAKATSAAKTAAKLQAQAAAAKAAAAAIAAKAKAAKAARAAAAAKAAATAKAAAAAKAGTAVNVANAAKNQAAAKAAVANAKAAAAKKAAEASKAAAKAQAAKAAKAAAAAKNAGKPTVAPTTVPIVTSSATSASTAVFSKPTLSTPVAAGSGVTTPPTVATTSNPAAKAPLTNKPGSPVKSFNAVVRLPSASYKPALSNKQSPQYKELANKLCNVVKSAVRAGKAITQCLVRSFSSGSLLVDFYLKFLNTIADPVQLLLNVIKTGLLGSIPVDKLPRRLYNGTGVTFPPGFSGCKPVGCPNPCLPPTCTPLCSTGIQCVTPPSSASFVPTQVIGPTVPVIPVSYPAPPVYVPAPQVSYTIPQPAPGPSPCPAPCLQHTPLYCPAYCAKRCCRAGISRSHAGKRSRVEKPPATRKSLRRVVLKEKRIHHKA